MKTRITSLVLLIISIFYLTSFSFKQEKLYKLEFSEEQLIIVKAALINSYYSDVIIKGIEELPLKEARNVVQVYQKIPQESIEILIKSIDNQAEKQQIIEEEKPQVKKKQ